MMVVTSMYMLVVIVSMDDGRVLGAKDSDMFAAKLFYGSFLP